MVLMGGVGCSLLLPQHLRAAGTSQGFPPAGPPAGAELGDEGKRICSGNFWEKERSSSSFSGWYNNLIYSCFASPVRAWQTMGRTAYQETKARKPAVQPTVEICFYA